ncbi:MAG: hypothetical protein MJE68_02810 [Proteobacteria bacterium]|nr:hypothetical protein [Pseudomonadota bacterium]
MLDVIKAITASCLAGTIMPTQLTKTTNVTITLQFASPLLTMEQNNQTPTEQALQI